MIYDAYTYKPVSRQRRYQLRQRAAGLCVTCGGPSNGSRNCPGCSSKKHKRDKKYQKDKKTLVPRKKKGSN